MAVDGRAVERTVGELRATLAEAGDLLAGLQRVVDATRTVVGVDGVGLTLAHEDGPPRWVATTDRAMELLEQIQEDFGEGPCLAAYAEARVVAVEDLRRAPRWDRIAAVVGQLQVRGMVSVPVRLAGQPVGTLDAYTTTPRAWSAQEIDALGALAAVTADLVRTATELANREVEVAQLRQALVGRIWIEQAKGVLAGTQGISPDAAFQQLRDQARSSRRKLADLAQEVVQDAQREQIAAAAVHDARIRAAEARAQAAEQALRAAQTGFSRRTAALDQAQDTADARERAADERDDVADERDDVADERNRIADQREQAADQRDQASDDPD
jgi:GAF domain-containing protein